MHNHFIFLILKLII